jgi:hypothetical protein
MTSLLSKPRIDVVRINVYGSHELEDEGWVSRVLDAVGAVPQAAPVRFSSDYGVHWTRFATTGSPRTGFDEACLTSQVEWQGSDVGFGGNIAALSATQTAVAHPTPFNHTTISVDANHPAISSDAGLRPLLLPLIEALGAVYAYGSWQRDVIHDKRRNLLWDKKSDHAEPRTLMGPQWLGLPSDHVFLEWFGSAYAPLIDEPLSGLTTQFAGGLLVEYGWDPGVRDRRLPRDLILDPGNGAGAAVVPAGW